MAKLLLVNGVLLFTITILVLGQEECSKAPKDVDLLKCCEPIKSQNLDEIIECEKIASSKPFCKAECVFNVTKIVQNGELKPENLKAVFDKTLKEEPNYIPIAAKAFTECFQLMKEKLAGKTANSDMCNPLAGAAFECMAVKIFVNCPADKWTSNKDCNEMKDFYSKCTWKLP